MPQTVRISLTDATGARFPASPGEFGWTFPVQAGTALATVSSQVGAALVSPVRLTSVGIFEAGVTQAAFTTIDWGSGGRVTVELHERPSQCSIDGALTCDLEGCCPDGWASPSSSACVSNCTGQSCGALGVPCPGGFSCESGAWCVSGDGLEVYVPSGRFWMGCNAALDSNCGWGESPQHGVDVPGYFIDRYEVTAAEYKAWCPSGACLPSTTADTSGTYAPSAKHNHPINYVTWFQSRDYCQAQGRRLCSEAEWEKAARGGCELYCPPGDDACCKAAMPTYPWGEAPATCAFAVMDYGGDGCGTGSTFAAGSKPAGASPYGVMDMAGSVWEWVQDCYHSTYTGAPSDGRVWKDVPADDQCSGSSRIHRGGCFFLTAAYLLAGLRYGYDPGGTQEGLGFRCCRSRP